MAGRKAEFKPRFETHSGTVTKQTLKIEADDSPDGQEHSKEISIYSGTFQDAVKMFGNSEPRTLNFLWKAFNSRFVKAPAVKEMRDAAEGPEKHLGKTAEAMSKIPGTPYYKDAAKAEAFLRSQLKLTKPGADEGNGKKK